MESQELEFFEELIDSYQSEYDVGLRRIAATLAFLVQKERPLQLEESAAEEAAAAAPPTPVGRERSIPEGGFQRYRIDVGRMHGVEPRHIVGAITNEAQLSSCDIGQIRIQEDHCLVDLPQKLPPKILRHLQGVWVCGRQLQLRPSGESAGGRPGGPPKRRPPGKGGEFRPSRPAPKKSPPSRKPPKK